MRRPEVPRPGNKYAWLVGILAFMGLSVLLFTTTLPNSGRGINGPEPGSRLKAFASPSALGDVEGEPNVCQREQDCNKTNGPIPACQVRTEGVVNLCDLRRKPVCSPSCSTAARTASRRWTAPSGCERICPG